MHKKLTPRTVELYQTFVYECEACGERMDSEVYLGKVVPVRCRGACVFMRLLLCDHVPADTTTDEQPVKPCTHCGSERHYVGAGKYVRCNHCGCIAPLRIWNVRELEEAVRRDLSRVQAQYGKLTTAVRHIADMLHKDRIQEPDYRAGMGTGPVHRLLVQALIEASKALPENEPTIED